MIENDTLANVLYIDLSKREFYVKTRTDIFEKYLGGSGVAIQLLMEELKPNCDPLSPDNPIIFAVGPLTGLYPLASKVVAMFKSPLTNNLGESHAGGRTAIALRSAGLGAIVIKGKSESPIYLSVQNGKAQFKDASALWGMESIYTVGRVLRQSERGSGMRTIMRIGKAGEKLIKYASVTTETYRHFGRLGLGAVFGSKKLKAILITGQNSIPVKNSKKYKSLYDQIYDEATKSKVMQKYHDLGTAVNVNKLNALKGLPTYNLQLSSFDSAENISGEFLASEYLGRRIACAHCPVACIHIASLRVPYENEKYFYKTTMIPYDYELIYALGSMLGVGNSKGLLKIIEIVEAYGIDAMSTGVCMAYATELFAKEKISVKETLGLKPKWGNWSTYVEFLKNLVGRKNKFYNALANGVDHAAGIYGGKYFALAFGGLEMPGYNTGPACFVGYLIGARHSHLDNAGYDVDQKHKGLAPEELVEKLIIEEQWRQVLSSLVVCFFSRGLYKPEIVQKCLASSGFNLDENGLMDIGKNILTEKFKFKFREGFSFDKLRLPGRIFNISTLAGKIDKDYIQKCLKQADKYYKTSIKNMK
jgi:aldehyde:ferredoxin oxidoreductase